MKKQRSKTRMGRPSKGKFAKTVNISVKASLEEIAKWKKAATAAGMSLGSWLALPRRQREGE